MLNLPGQVGIIPVNTEHEAGTENITAMLTSIFDKIAENDANQKKSIEETKLMQHNQMQNFVQTFEETKMLQQNQMQNFAQVIEQKFGENVTAILNLERNSNRQEQQNNVLQQSQQGIANEVTQTAHGNEFAMRLQQEMVVKYQMLEQKLHEMQQNATRSSSSNAVPVKRYIDPELEEQYRKNRVVNKANMIDQIQSQIQGNFKPAKPAKSLSDFTTYVEWRESTNRWSLMCGGSHPCQLILEILEAFQKKQ